MEGTGLVLDNTRMAATRPLFSRVRTGAATVGGGALVTDLLIKGSPRWMVLTLSSAFVVLGCSLMGSVLKTGRRLRAQVEHTQRGEAFLFPLRKVTVWTLSLQLLLVLVLYFLG